MSKYQINKLLKFAEEDNYQEGCDPDTTVMFDLDVSFRGNSAEEVIKSAAEYLGIEEDGIERNACEEKGRVDFQGMETDDSMTPTKNQLKEWKKGNFRLWNTIYTAYVEKVSPAKL